MRDLAEMIVDTVLGNEAFSETVKNIIQEEIEEAVNDATRHLNNDKPTAKLMSEGEDHTNQIEEVRMHLEETINGLIAEHDTLVEHNSILLIEIRAIRDEIYQIRDDYKFLINSTGNMNRYLTTVSNSVDSIKKSLKTVPIVRRWFM